MNSVLAMIVLSVTNHKLLVPKDCVLKVAWGTSSKSAETGFMASGFINLPDFGSCSGGHTV